LKSVLPGAAAREKPQRLLGKLALVVRRAAPRLAGARANLNGEGKRATPDDLTIRRRLMRQFRTGEKVRSLAPPLDHPEGTLARSSPAHCEERVTADGVPASGSMVPHKRCALAQRSMSGDVAADAEPRSPARS
jgi:hypothetical protein